MLCRRRGRRHTFVEGRRRCTVGVLLRNTPFDSCRRTGVLALWRCSKRPSRDFLRSCVGWPLGQQRSRQRNMANRPTGGGAAGTRTIKTVITLYRCGSRGGRPPPGPERNVTDRLHRHGRRDVGRTHVVLTIIAHDRGTHGGGPKLDRLFRIRLGSNSRGACCVSVKDAVGRGGTSCQRSRPDTHRRVNFWWQPGRGLRHVHVVHGGTRDRLLRRCDVEVTQHVPGMSRLAVHRRRSQGVAALGIPSRLPRPRLPLLLQLGHVDATSVILKILVRVAG
mmetsp:Transcript_26758/g.70290  ORF Transcript_26758/g.70290 Transcript_26758/m.70290 type:complete len:278 (-) Transcript_26758:520-1353(-)